jgi:rubredoxin
MTSIIEAFVEEARGVSIEEAAGRLGLKFRKSGKEHPQACPVSGGTDRFSFNTDKNNWHCRHCSVGGKDAIGMAAHNLGLDLKVRSGFLEACSAVLGRDIPAEGERESEEERLERLARIEEQRRRNAEAEKDRAAAQADFRERERRKARGIYEAAALLTTSSLPHGRAYLKNRGAGVPRSRWLHVAAEVPYWHGQDDRGAPLALYTGPAMIAPFIDPAGVIIGCHITWIDLARAPKFRPLLFGLTQKGMKERLPEWRYGDPPPDRQHIEAEFYEVLPTKKMRGTKKGGVIPLCGSPAARRWVGAEGIENTLAFARIEGFRADTFYFAAGDLGNMAGPADPKSRFAHPELTKPDRLGRERPVMVAGPVPLMHGDVAEPDAMVVPDHVDKLVFLADGDSERVMTAAAMARARTRHARPGRLIPVVWPRQGTDWAALLAGTGFDEVGA